MFSKQINLFRLAGHVSHMDFLAGHSRDVMAFMAPLIGSVTVYSTLMGQSFSGRAGAGDVFGLPDFHPTLVWKLFGELNSIKDKVSNSFEHFQ